MNWKLKQILFHDFYIIIVLLDLALNYMYVLTAELTLVKSANGSRGMKYVNTTQKLSA